MKRIKQGLCLALCLCMVLTFAGCGQTPEQKPTAESDPAQAMGRYVEETVALPPCRNANDMVLLEDGRLRIVLTREDGRGVVYTTGPDRKGWLDIFEIPNEICDQGTLAEAALSPDGTVFCDIRGKESTEGNYTFHFWVIDPDGSFREIPVTLPDLDTAQPALIEQCDFTDSGRLIARFYTGEVQKIDLKTGELGDNLNALERSIRKLGCAGENIYEESKP